jgi:hypothetical protein
VVQPSNIVVVAYSKRIQSMHFDDILCTINYSLMHVSPS